MGEMIPSSKQGVRSNGRRERGPQPSVSLHAAAVVAPIVDDKHEIAGDDDATAQ